LNERRDSAPERSPSVEKADFGRYGLAMPDTRPGIRALASKTRARIRSRGTREVVDTWLTMLKQLHSPEQKLILFYRNLNERDDSPPAAPSGAVFKEATDIDADLYARDVGTDSAKTFRSRLSDRTHSFVVVENDTILHASWVTSASAWTRELQRYFCPPGGEAYIYESYTRPETRGRGIYPFALHSICTWLSKRGFARVWVGVEGDNQSSRRAISKAGFSPGFEIRYQRRLGRVSVAAPEGPGARPDHPFLSTSPDCRPG
jgi:RimJ/RimL family protein N-acetyltransferase